MIYSVNSSGKIEARDGKMVLVRSEADLPAAAGFGPSTIAYTAGFNNMWQLDESGTWQTITEESGS